MRRTLITMIGLLLASATAEATVYVWEEDEALVMTNDEEAVSNRLAPHEMTTYATAESPPAESPKRLETIHADGTKEPATAEAAPAAPGPAGVVASSTMQAGGAGAPAPAAPADRRATAPAPNAPAQVASAQPSDPASLAGMRVEPRALFDRKREPPQFIVSVVEPSSGPLSTSLRETRPSISETGTSGVRQRDGIVR